MNVRCAALALLVSLALAGAAFAQTNRQTGLHYFAIEDRDADRVVQRGTAGGAGVAFDQLILSPTTRYRAWILQAATSRVGIVEFTTPPSGRTFTVPPIEMREPNPWDSDGDGLHDTGEFILGTVADDPDSDDDGILDGAEVAQGSNPLDGAAAVTGIIGSALLPDTARDVCALDDLVAVAHETGVSVFNVFNAMAPVIVAQTPTLGTATRVACAGNLIAAATGAGGLVVVDLSNAPAAEILHALDLGSATVAVTTAATIAYVGLSNGDVVAVDMVSGSELGRDTTGARPHDLALAEDGLFVLERNRLRVLEPSPASLAQLGSITVISDSPEGITGTRRLAVGGGLAYLTGFSGYQVIDVADPTAMASLGLPSTPGPNSFKQIIPNGSGLGVAVVGQNPRADGTHNVSLYDISDPAVTGAFLTEFPTPGLTRAVAIYNGIAYAADSDAGLQVVSYLGFDSLGVAPTVQLDASFPLAPPQVEESRLVRVSALVTDDVQVRNVEFYVDGLKVRTDGNFPFEHRFVTPRLADQASFRLRVRASDTGGNATFSPEITVALVPDATRPQLQSVSPADGSVLDEVDSVAAFFSESIDPATIAAGFTLVEAGPDGLLGGPDDAPVATGLTYRDEVFGAFLDSGGLLPPGSYRASVGPPLADLAGNPIAAALDFDFVVYDSAGADTDGDGLTDALEPLLGLTVGSMDSDGDGILDGDEDFDGDGLGNAAEVTLGSDPTNFDSNGNGVPDGQEDADLDGLTAAAEVAAGTDVTNFDSDGDGFPDGVELETGVLTDPRNGASRPPLSVTEAPRQVDVLRLDFDAALFGTTVAGPPLSLLRIDFTETTLGGTFVAQPPVGVLRIDFAETTLGGTFVAQPPVGVLRIDFAEATLGGTFVAQPPVEVEIIAP